MTKQIPCLHFRMTDHHALAVSFGPRVVRTVTAAVSLPGVDATPEVNTRSTFAALALELGLREVES